MIGSFSLIPFKDAAALLLAAVLSIGGCGNQDARGATPASEAGVSSNIAVNLHILVDQFGYLPDSSKVAVIRDPRVGYDKSDKFVPGTSYQVRSARTGDVVFAGSPRPWKSGSTEDSSGDRGWWFDFSSVAAPGQYFVYDVAANVRSPMFLIDSQVYGKVLKAALRMYFYQRSGFPKLAPHAEACWTDAAAYMGKGQDREAHDVTDRDNPSKVRDLGGGWFDAGDTNKYTTQTVQPIHQLLTAYGLNKAAFTDDLNIPESGNGIPDVLDEVKWETDWLKKMQNPDGSFLLKVGDIVYVGASPPSSDSSPRYYVPSCTSATIAAAGTLAHAAYVYAQFAPLASEALDLQRRAGNAWRNYQGIGKKQTACDSGVVKAGIADLSVEDQNGLAVEAAIYLFALTSERTYDDYVKAHYKETRSYRDVGWSRYNADQGEALLFYTSLQNADAALKRTLLADKLSDVKAGNKIYGFAPDDDLYRAYLHDPQYHWGSNNPRANYGNTNLDALTYNVGVENATSYRERALGILHYFHGVNPFGMVYLTNMYAYGATNSANEIYHTWFLPDTKWSDAKTSSCGPPPGYVPGGPNSSAANAGVPAYLSPPTGQPPQKSYKDWNKAWPENAWAVTEPAIYYQSAYIRLLSAFVK
jgi:endoglucanase